MDIYIDEEVVKWRKKGNSSVSQASKKSDHKHDWQPSMVGYERKPNALYNDLHKPVRVYGLGRYCTICDKIQLRSWWYQKDGRLYDDIWSLTRFFPDYPVKESETEKW